MAFSSTTKYNYIDIVNRMVPEIYRETDFRLFGEEEDVSLTFLGNLLKSAIQNNLYFDVSTLDTSTLAKWFVPNEQTHITPNSFQGKILTPYGLTFDSFQNKEELKGWLSGTFLPDAVVNNPVGFFSEVSSYGFGFASSLPLVHSYLIDSLGLFYFMNDASLSGSTASANASALMVDYLIDPLYAGTTVTTKDGLNALFRFFWENRDDSSYYASFFPTTHVSSAAALSANQYLSGTQMFDAIQLQLQTWTDDKLKDSDFYKVSLNTLLDSPQGKFPTKLRNAGPFQRFLKAISLGMGDINLIIEEIGDLLSIDDCPEQFMELLANNIGWQFLTGDYGKWRAQLRNAVMVYKTKGSTVGLNAVCKLIFPNGTFAASDIGEAWESYLPKLLYYLVKTESFIAREGLEFDSKDALFDGSWPSGVRFNQAPLNYQAAEDRNYRFLVDGILEHYNKVFSGIVINGRPFQELRMWTCLPGPEDVKGFYHRNYPNDTKGDGTDGFKVAVPPWEKYGFYTEAELNSDSVEFFCNILSGSRDDFGFEVSSTYVEGFKTLLMTAIDTVYNLSGTPTLAVNNKFRLFTHTHQFPPNYSKYITYGNTEELALLDLWNTKSSFIFGVFNASSLDYTVDAFDTFRNKAALETFVDVLRTFIPLHVVARIVLYQDLEDTHPPYSKLCVISDWCLDDFNTGYLNSQRSDFWVGASGGGNLSSTLVNGDGRVLPSYLSGITPPSSMFWQVSSTTLNRNTSRRRNYRYALDCYPYTRPGTSMPIALNHYGVATSGATLDEYMNTWEYIPKGFEYDTQTFADVSSAIWDNSGWYSGDGDCGLGDNALSSGVFPLSSLYPVRAVDDDSFQCSSVVIYRDTMKGILEVMTDRTIREQGSRASFSDLNYRSYKFGDSVHENYSVYKNEFSSVLKNTLGPSIPYYGGYNFISYAYGPTVWNCDFRYPGLIATNAGSPGPKYPGSTDTAYGYESQWSSVVGGTDSGGLKYHNYSGSGLTISLRPYFKDAPDASALDAPNGVWRSANEQITNEILSGIQIRQPYDRSASFAVVNSPSRSITKGSFLSQSISLFNSDGKPLEVVVPFDPSLSAENQFNKLRPQSQFTLDLRAITQRSLIPQDISVQLVTSGLFADDGTTKEWSFCWRDEKWVPTDTVDDHVFTKTLSVSENLLCPTILSVPFHTQDIFTIKSTPCGAVFRSSDVHTSGTGYLLKVWNNTTAPQVNGIVQDGLVLNEISIVDKVLNHKMNAFNSSACDIIYTFWDGLSVGAYSRNKTYSETAFDTSGGSKAEYLELLGGPDYSLSAHYGAGSTYLSYEVKD